MSEGLCSVLVALGDCFLSFSYFLRLPTFLGSWPLIPSSQPETLHLSDHDCFRVSDHSQERFSDFKEPFDWVSLSNPRYPHLKVLNLSHICKVILLYNVPYLVSRDLGRHVWGSLDCLPQLVSDHSAFAPPTFSWFPQKIPNLFLL